VELSRRTFIAGLASTGAMAVPGRAAAQRLPRVVAISCISWIDSSNLPDLNTVGAFGRAITFYWPFKVMVGLVATSNPRPPETLPESFTAAGQHRAFSAYHIAPTATVSDPIVDGGFTPGIDLERTPKYAPDFLFSGYDKAHPGETSALSGIVSGRLHPASTLETTAEETVLASALVKFRAGKETDTIGIETAGSPYHVPWVWHEHALIRQGDGYLLRVNGSRFPSHAWYVDGKRLGFSVQEKVTLSDAEPALIAGPRVGSTPVAAKDDKASGRVTTHPFTVAARPNGAEDFAISF